MDQVLQRLGLDTSSAFIPRRSFLTMLPKGNIARKNNTEVC
jgi:hypothetical protein